MGSLQWLKSQQFEKNMAKNTNPLTTRLLKKDFWYINSLPLDETPYLASDINKGYLSKGSDVVIQYKYIKSLIHSSFMKLGILTSEVRLSKNCINTNVSTSKTLINLKAEQPMVIQFMYYPLAMRNGRSLRSNQKQIISLIKVLKLILKLKYPFYKIKFICIKAPHKFLDAKILNDFIHFSSFSNPNKLKFVILSLIKEFRQYRFNYVNRKYLKGTKSQETKSNKKGSRKGKSKFSF